MMIPDVIRENARQMEQKDLEEYILKVNKLLEGMKQGDSLVIIKITRPETRDLFLETIKYYMRQHEWQDGLSFADGFSELRKYDLAFIKRQKKVNPLNPPNGGPETNR